MKQEYDNDNTTASPASVVGMHVDWFGAELAPGDKVLRPMHSELHEETIDRLTPRAVFFKRTDQWSIKKGLPPLRVAITDWWNTMNLIKLNNKDSNEH